MVNILEVSHLKFRRILLIVVRKKYCLREQATLTAHRSTVLFLNSSKLPRMYSCSAERSSHSPPVTGDRRQATFGTRKLFKSLPLSPHTHFLPHRVGASTFAGGFSEIRAENITRLQKKIMKREKIVRKITSF